MHWIRCGIPNFSSIIRLLAVLLEKVYSAVGKRTCLAADLVSLKAINCNSDHDDSFCSCKLRPENRVILAHVDKSKPVCVLPDSLDYFWSGAATQIPIFDSPLPCVDQRDKPPVFLSGHFHDATARRPTNGKEAFAIMTTI